MSNTISRVLYQTIIYLGLLLPASSSNLPETRRAAVSSLFGLASDGVYTALSVTREAVSSYLAFSPLPQNCGGSFLLHWPGSRLHRTLSGILPCEARTFLTCGLSTLAAAIVCAAHSFHFIMRAINCKEISSDYPPQ